MVSGTAALHLLACAAPPARALPPHAAEPAVAVRASITAQPLAAARSNDEARGDRLDRLQHVRLATRSAARAPYTTTRRTGTSTGPAAKTAPTSAALEAASAWQRIRDMLTTRLSALPAAGRARVDKEIAWFRRHRTQLGVDNELLDLYLPHIVEAVAGRGLPGELALIPLVESGFAGKALSHAGALGVWQLMPGTARDHGLVVTPEYDGRLDVFEATRAALDLLAHNYGIDRNWLRTIASYNAGLGKVRSAVRQNVTARRGVSFWDLQLPAETRVYVARLLAAAAIVRDPGSHGFTLPTVAAAPRLVLLRPAPSGRVSLADFAASIGWTATAAARANPHLGRVLSPANRAVSLLVPSRFAAAATRWLREPRPEAARAAAGQSIQHRIEKGETLISIARRYGTTVTALRDANDIAGSIIRHGKTLQVPLPPGPPPNDTRTLPTAALDTGAG